jgi:cytochrome b6-f complex iron-sulfur subunit
VPWFEPEQRFACPCHASAFDIRGAVVNPPAPRPLDLFTVSVDSGVVKVDTGRLIRRTSFESGQAVRA